MTMSREASRWIVLYTSAGLAGMRTNIDIDNELLFQAMAASGLSTKRATVEEGLRLLVRVGQQAQALARLKGLGWDGDLEDMRRGRPARRLWQDEKYGRHSALLALPQLRDADLVYFTPKSLSEVGQIIDRLRSVIRAEVA